jgi:spore germination cell wall hydrolase CwlJ-like protein
MDTARLYFGVGALDAPPDELDRPEAVPEHEIPMPAHRPADAGGETVAGKGEVTGNGKAPSSPAERLGLAGKSRARAEKCLAEAVYFESRGESVRGQMAVAQVVMNRVFSDFYPGDVCDVVYQNAHRRLACQFTFACDGIRDVVRDQDAWQRAKRIAADTLDGKLWLEDVGKATHYHAYWVRPWWIRTMRKLHKIGVHSFYRPRRWGDGSDEPMWGNAAATAEAAKTL